MHFNLQSLPRDESVSRETQTLNAKYTLQSFDKVEMIINNVKYIITSKCAIILLIKPILFSPFVTVCYHFTLCMSTIEITAPRVPRAHRARRAERCDIQMCF